MKSIESLLEGTRKFVSEAEIGEEQEDVSNNLESDNMMINEKEIRRIVKESFAKLASRMGADKLKQSTGGTRGREATPPSQEEEKSDFIGQELPNKTPFGEKQIQGLSEAVINRIAQIVMEQIVSSPSTMNYNSGGDNKTPAQKQTAGYTGASEPAPTDGETPQTFETSSGGDNVSPASKQTKGDSGPVEPAPKDGDTPQKMMFENKEQMVAFAKVLTERVIKELLYKK